MITTIIFDFGDIFLNLEKEAQVEAFKKLGLSGPNEELIAQNDLFEKGKLSEIEFLQSFQKYIPNASIIEIKEAWKNEANRATTLGTWYHNQREEDICQLETLDREGVAIPVFTPLMNTDGSKQAPDQKLTEGIYPEHMVYLKSAGI